MPVLFVMPALGAVVLLVIVVVALAVQPLLPVAVTVYVPAAVALISAVVAFPPVAFHR